MSTPWDKQHNQQKRWRIEPMDEVALRFASYFWPDEDDWFVIAKRSHDGVISAQFTPTKNRERWERPDLAMFYSLPELEVA
jgi:hypothetical protein